MSSSEDPPFVSEEEDEDGEERFFDTREDLSCGSASPGSHRYYGTRSEVESDYLIWLNNTLSVQERRRKFREDYSLRSICNSKDSSFDLNEPAENSEVVEDPVVVQGARVGLSSSCPHGGMGNAEDVPSNSTSEASSDPPDCDGLEEEKLENKKSDGGWFSGRKGGACFSCTTLPDELSSSRGSQRFSNMCSSSSTPSYFVGTESRRNRVVQGSEVRVTGSRKPSCWLRWLGVTGCAANRQGEVDDSVVVATSDESVGRKANRVKVHQCGKQPKEFSALYTGQDLKAHDGAISAMRFSPDGQYLATGGEDRLVRVWKVIECDFDGERDLPRGGDPPSMCFTANHSFHLDPLPKNKEKRRWKSGGITSRASDAACVIIPPKVFRISEEPIHEFRGHGGKVLDLSWSNNKHLLLSSSEDKSVRLWQVGCSKCIGLFPHNDFVTCVQFSPVDENFFVSGSLDFKVRIWDISDCHVMSWADMKEMVTAVCYQPDGKGIVAGSMGGICSFYEISDDNHLHLIEAIRLHSKKKYPSNFITGFQFSPTESQKLMVTSADSQIKIMDGSTVVGRYKGLRNGNCQISAYFTADGRHIVSASKESNVHIWSHNKRDLDPEPNGIRSTHNREYFFSRSVSIAIPWHPPGSKERLSMASDVFSTQREASRELRTDADTPTCCNFNTPGRSSYRFALNQRFFTELLPRGSATWPEEKLPSISAETVTPVLSKPDYKFLEACCEKALVSHAWGQVIVTAGWDGRIRSYCNYGLPVGS